MGFGSSVYGTDDYNGGLDTYVVRDNYKSKLIRHHFPPPYDTRLASNLGKLLTVIATSDNNIGGLFPPFDFLPEDP